jgi:hypothetical protein
MTRECHVRFSERLGVKIPVATLPTGTAFMGRPVIPASKALRGIIGPCFGPWLPSLRWQS